MNTGSPNPGSTTTPRNTGTIMRDLQRIWQVLRDPNVPGWKWLLPIGAFLYWIWPLDLIPGIPIDDIAVVIFAISMLLQMTARVSPPNATDTSGQPGATPNNATPNNKEQIVDTTWRVVDK